MAETFKNHPGTKEYRAADGHLFEVNPQWSQYNQEWYYVYSFASHSENCTCDNYHVEEYAGENE